MINALLNTSGVRRLIETEHENCELIALFRQFLQNPEKSWNVLLVKQLLHDYVVKYNQTHSIPLTPSIFFNNTEQQDSPEFFLALIQTSKPLSELFEFEMKKFFKCQKCDTPLSVSDTIDTAQQLNLMSDQSNFSSKQLLLDSRQVPSDIPCKTCHPRRYQPKVNMADGNEVFVTLPQLLFITVNSWEPEPPFLKKHQNVKPSPTLWVGDKVYVLRSTIQHHGVSKGKTTRMIHFIYPY